MVSRNPDTFSFILGLTAGSIAFLSFIFTCVGVGLPTWYIGTDANNTNTIAEGNLFSTCFAPNTTQGVLSTTFTCTSYNSYICSTTSYRNTVFNVTAYVPGCTNPTNGSSIYQNVFGPVYQILLSDYYNVRNAAIFSIISVLLVFFSSLFSFITAVIALNIFLVFVAPVLACMSILFGLCCLAMATSAFHCTGSGFALFTTGVLLQVFVTTLSSIAAGRLNLMQRNDDIDDKSDGKSLTQRSDSPIFVRRKYIRKT